MGTRCRQSAGRITPFSHAGSFRFLSRFLSASPTTRAAPYGFCATSWLPPGCSYTGLSLTIFQYPSFTPGVCGGSFGAVACHWLETGGGFEPPLVADLEVSSFKGLAFLLVAHLPAFPVLRQGPDSNWRSPTAFNPPAGCTTYRLSLSCCLSSCHSSAKYRNLLVAQHSLSIFRVSPYPTLGPYSFRVRSPHPPATSMLRVIIRMATRRQCSRSGRLCSSRLFR